MTGAPRNWFKIWAYITVICIILINITYRNTKGSLNTMHAFIASVSMLIISVSLLGIAIAVHLNRDYGMLPAAVGVGAYVYAASNIGVLQGYMVEDG